MILVIGYGNGLRGDDGVGLRIVEQLPAMAGVEALTRHQLTPELAAPIADAEAVIFVDAHAGDEAGCVRRTALTGAQEAGGAGHTATAAGLVTLVEGIYGRRPQAFLVSVGAASFEFGDTLSPRVAAAIPVAVTVVQRLVRQLAWHD